MEQHSTTELTGSSVILAAAAHFAYINSWEGARYPGVALVTPFICLQVEVFYAIMSTTFPCIGSFMKALNTRWGALDGAESSYAGDSRNTTDKVHHELPGTELSTIHPALIGLTPHANSYSSRIEKTPIEHLTSTDSEESDHMAIRKTVQTIIRHGYM
jgi:hypothetical protein